MLVWPDSANSGKLVKSGGGRLRETLGGTSVQEPALRRKERGGLSRSAAVESVNLARARHCGAGTHCFLAAPKRRDPVPGYW